MINTKQAFFSFFLLLTLPTNIFSLTTISECLDSTDIIESQKELQSPEKMKIVKNIMKGFDTAYKSMDDKLGNDIIHKLEEMLEGFIFQFLIDAKDAILNQKCLDEIAVILDTLVNTIKESNNTSTEDAVQFTISIWTIRSITAGLKASSQGLNDEESKLNQHKIYKHMKKLFDSFITKYNVKLPKNN